jgi:hypothetical protein
MIESLKDLKHNRTSYESLKPSRNPSMSHLQGHGHHSAYSHSHTHSDSPTACSDSLTTTKSAVISNASAIYGPSRSLDIVTYATTHSRQITAAIVEHSPHGRSYIHCCSAKEDTRLAAVEHLLVITEDILQRLIDKESISSSGWLPATPQSQHAAAFNQSTVTQGTLGHLGSVPNLMRLETASSKASTPSVVPGDRQTIMGPLQQQGVMPPRDMVVAPQQQIIATPQQAVAPQPTRAGRVQWMMGSEG